MVFFSFMPQNYTKKMISDTFPAEVYSKKESSPKTPILKNNAETLYLIERLCIDEVSYDKLTLWEPRRSIP